MPRTSISARRRNNSQQNQQIRFDQRLVLNRWIVRLFEVESFEKLAEQLKDPSLEGFDENNISRFFHVLRERLFERQELSADILRAYDENIVRHWQAITANRNRGSQNLFPKYFQYLALLFTEIYLDRYFRNPGQILSDLNRAVSELNEGKPESQQIDKYENEQLNKLAFWMATGSGKTLLMHVNMKQYQYYLNLNGHDRKLNRILLLTPNEGLSRQHLEEFRLSGIEAELFTKEGRGLFSGQHVEIIDIHKLKEDMGEKTVAVDAFEGNNLVLVDEGHRGTSSAEEGHWMKMRNRLCEKGFSFEYSATFGQAIKAGGSRKLEQEYARCIVFNYSYKYFYKDGYGKDYHILNLEEDSQEELRQLYLTACLLVFYQQLKLFKDRQNEFRPYLLEKPLWVFVGGKVNAVRTTHGRQVSDVTDILLNISAFIDNKNLSLQRIERLLRGNAGLLDSRGREIFANAFSYIANERISADEIFQDILQKVFNSSSQAKLHVENLKGSDGELALRLGNNEPFGVINVGDAPALYKLCEEYDELALSEREFSGSLFHGLSGIESTINLLIGSKKFSEGWNSWRVSTMGLMNVGRSEGSEIIQLFGRGVRLKGMGFCLKRSNHVPLPGHLHPKHIGLLETLNIFGIRADYMRQFKEYLEDEGLPANEERIEFFLPVVKNLGNVKLQTIKIKEGIDFKKHGPKPALELHDEIRTKNHIVLDWYPKIQTQKSSGIQMSADQAEKNKGTLTNEHIAFIDIDKIFFALEDFKNERSWHNLSLSKEAISVLLSSNGWYELYIPPEELDFRDFKRVKVWEEIAVALLKKYCDKYYKLRKDEYERPHLEYGELGSDDPNFFEEHRFLIEQSRNDIVEKLEELKKLIEKKQLRDYEIGNLHAISFGQHLYEPLIYLNSDVIEVRPVPLNEGERDFVLDLRSFYQNNKKVFEKKELYLLRNLSRGKGVGFFEAGNFYPDFILWLLDDKQQFISFIDPKGLRNLEGINDPKISFYKTIKEIEQRLGNSNITLNSFIISQTPYMQVRWWEKGITEEEFEEHHVFFKEGNRENIIRKIFDRLDAQ